MVWRGEKGFPFPESALKRRKSNNMKTTTPKPEQKERPRYNMWQNSAYMIHRAWKVRKSVLVLCLLLAVLAVATNLTELFIAPVILQKVETAVPLPELLSTILIFAGILIGLAALTAYVSQNTLFGRIEIRFSFVRQAGYKQGTTSFPNTEDTNILKKLDKATTTLSDNSQASEAIWNTLTDLLKNISGFLIYLFLMSSFDKLLLTVVSATTVMGYFINKYIYEWSYRHREEEAEYSKHLNYISQKAEETALAKDIRIFGMRSWLEDIYSSTRRLYQAFIVRREKTYLLANILDVLLSFLRNGIAYLYLITITINKGLPASLFLLYFSAVNGFTAWIMGILEGFSTLHRQSLDLSVVREYFAIPEPFLFEKGEPLQTDKNIPYELRLNHVSFRYPHAKKDTLHNVNLTIYPGEKLAIVGLNGAGKTTLVKLLCGFYDPTEGEVLLNGVDIRQYNREDYYALFSAVFQQFSVLDATLAENVAQTATDIDYQKVADCIAKAGLTAKEQTHIGRQVYEDGVELSGGQMQRLMLARALYKDAPVIVLDEPTAALDPIAENDIYLKYNEMTEGRTSVFISHRLASTRFCDRIIFLADGSIAEEGTHESLMEQNRQYAKLFHIQSKYYREGGNDAVVISSTAKNI